MSERFQDGHLDNVLGFRVAQLLGGTVTIELVFNINGLGRLAINSTLNHDIPVLLGINSAGARPSVNPRLIHGRSLFYSTAIGTEPKFADVIIEQAAAFDAQKRELDSVS